MLRSICEREEALRQRADLGRDDGKALDRFTSACGFDPGIQGEQIGLKGDFVNDPNDLSHLAWGFFDMGHRADGVAHDQARGVGLLFGIKD